MRCVPDMTNGHALTRVHALPQVAIGCGLDGLRHDKDVDVVIICDAGVPPDVSSERICKHRHCTFYIEVRRQPS